MPRRNPSPRIPNIRPLPCHAGRSFKSLQVELHTGSTFAQPRNRNIDLRRGGRPRCVKAVLGAHPALVPRRAANRFALLRDGGLAGPSFARLLARTDRAGFWPFAGKSGIRPARSAASGPKFRRPPITLIRRFSSAVEQRFCNSLGAISPRFVLYREVPNCRDFLAALASIMSSHTALCYRVR